MNNISGKLLTIFVTLMVFSAAIATAQASLSETPRGISVPKEIPNRNRFVHNTVPVNPDHVVEAGIPERQIFSGHPNDLKIVRGLMASGLAIRGRDDFSGPEVRPSLIPLHGVEYQSPRQNVVGLPRGAIIGITGGWHVVCYCYKRIGR